MFQGEPVWLAFTPKYTAPRGSQAQPLGAHAFRTGPRSLCGSIAREQAGVPAVADERRCVWCERVIRGTSVDRSGSEAEATHA